jgi:predicted RNA methylase
MRNAHSIVGTSCIAAACLLLGACGTQPFDPDCTAEKAARSTAMKATVGVGGRCTPKEAVADTIERNTGAD